MLTIIELLYRDYIKPYKRMLLVITLIIIFTLAAIYAYRIFARPLIENQSVNNVANANRRPIEVQVYFFYANWCPHCKTAKPEWNAFKSAYDGKEINGNKVKLIDVDCTKEDNKNSDLIQRFKIDSYPTLKLVKDNNNIDFDSKITNDALTQFLQTVLK